MSDCCRSKKILPVNVNYFPGSSDEQKVEVPEKYGKVCRWEIKDRFGEGWNPISSLPYKNQCHQRCSYDNNVLIITDELVGSYQHYDTVVRAVVKDCKGKKFCTNEVQIVTFVCRIVNQTRSVPVLPGQTVQATLFVELSGCPNAVVRWEKQAAPVQAAGKVSIKADWVVIPESGANINLLVTVGEKYRALVDNGFSLNIVSEPIDVGYVIITSAGQNEEDNYVVEYEAVPAPGNIRWYYLGGDLDGQLISDQNGTPITTPVLLSENLRDETDGIRVCVSNSVETKCAVALEPTEP